MSTTVRVRAFDTGYCVARAGLIARGTGWHEARCHAPAFLIEHPGHGPLLFDTGYAPRLLDAFRTWPARIYALATPTTIGMPLVAQLAGAGVAAHEVRTVIVSHLHADHVAGLLDFAAARFVVSGAALALQRRARGVDAVRRGIVQQLFPADFDRRATVIDAFAGEALPALGATHDLLGDGSVRLVPLPGHARGQLGAMLRTDTGDVLLCADGAWSTRAYRELRPPHPITRLMQDDLTELVATLDALRRFAAARPACTILPTHCPDTLRWAAGS
ncbi:MAG: MBL fold metallo-hydrolase [Gemmatimonadaceae bacterium]|nr:MBL fold metallo-hydrolase [Gemmatimonadaceae bacterium]